MLYVLCVFGALGHEAAYCQPPPNGSASQAAITLESIESLRKQAADSTDLDAEVKQKIETLCAQALDGFKRIAEAAGQAEQFKRDAEEIEQRAADRKRALENLQNPEPIDGSQLSLPELEREVSRREVDLAEKKAALAKADTEPSARVNRRKEIRNQLLSANQRMVEIRQQLDIPPPADESPLLTQARRADLQVRRLLVEAELPALQNEREKYDAEDAASFLRLERDLRTQEVAIASSELETLQSLLSERRANDSADTLRRAREAVNSTPPALESSAKYNVKIANAADALSQPIDELRVSLENRKARLEQIQKQFTMIQQRVSDIGLTGSIGAELRRRRVELPNVRQLNKNIQERKSLIEAKQFQLFGFDDLRSEPIDKTVAQILKEEGVDNEADRKKLEPAARIVAEKRREYLDGAIRNYNAYLETLFALDATEQRLIRETKKYRDYIDERVLWIRSNLPIFSFPQDDLVEPTDDRPDQPWTDPSDTWMFDPARWNEVGRQLVGDVRSSPLVYGLGVIAFALLVWQKPRFRRELTAISQVVTRGTCTDFLPTVRAGFLTLMHAAAWPGLVLFLAWRMNASSNGSQFARALSDALFSMSWVYFPLELLRQVCRPHGLAASHFGWPATAIRVFRSNLRWAAFLGILMVLVTSLLYASDPEHGIDTIERLCFVTGLLILTIFLARVLRPGSGVFCGYLAAHTGEWFDRLKSVWYWGCVLVPLTIACMTLLGYYYTAQQLTWRFYATFVFFAVLQLIRSFLDRLLLVRRRTISIEQARERRAKEAASRENSLDAAQLSPNQLVPSEEIHPDVAANTEQSQRLLKTGLIAASLIGMWLIWVDVLPALRILDEWEVWTTTVAASVEPPAAPTPVAATPTSQEADAPATPTSRPTEVLRIVTVADIGLAVLIGIVTIVCARNVPGLMEISILQRLPLDNSIRYAVTSVTSYAIVLMGCVLAFNALMIGWSKVQWVATALTFGLAFGLQEIFANFVAGLILLFERPIRVGDVVTIDDVTGVVSRIRIRATTITNWDRKEYVIPNKEFITGRMLNWTLSDKTNRIVINVGVAYGSDIGRAKELLLSTCHDNPLLLDDPPTLVTFEGFGDNTLNLVVRAFLPDLDNRLSVIDQLHTAIDENFRHAGIEIAFPQRDLHLRSVAPAVWERFQQDGGRDAA